MKGLILKDLMNLKRQGTIIGVLLVFYMIISLSTGNPSMFGGVIAVLMAMMPITALSYDERAKWDKYALTMPVTRREMVISKYLLGLLLSAAAFVIILVFNLFTASGDLAEILLSSLLLCGLGIFFLALSLPLLFRFGVEKARLLMVLVYFVPVGAILLASNLFPGFTATESPILLLAVGIPALAGLLLLSMALSIRIYNRKEIQ